jgi:hypothetical protein
MCAIELLDARGYQKILRVESLSEMEEAFYLTKCTGLLESQVTIPTL